MRRIGYFLATNAAVMVVFGVILMLLPEQFRSNNVAYMFIALIFGFGGALFSLFRSKKAAIKGAQVQLIDRDNPQNETEQWLVNTVRRQAGAAGIGMPDVGIFPAPEMNAFATGANKNDALVAVSVGLLNNMTREEAEAVMGHEIAHVANGDMVTLTLITGVANTFVMIFARMVAQLLNRGGNGGMGYFVGYMIAQTFFNFLANIIISYFSRRREYRADEGGAQYSSKQNMINALDRLRQGQAGELPNQLAAFGISSGMKKMFSTHPPLEERIQALRDKQ